jgi:hypothetical protein
MLMATLIALLPMLTSAQDVPVVERGRVGPVAIGALAETIYGEFRDRARLIDLKLEGHLSPALEIKLFGAQATASLVAEIWPSDNKLVVTRIRVLDARLRTKEGIGIGSSYADLRSHYSVDWVGSGEGDFFARVEALGISFALDMSGVQAAGTIRSPARVPADARVVGMLLTR